MDWSLSLFSFEWVKIDFLMFIFVCEIDSEASKKMDLSTLAFTKGSRYIAVGGSSGEIGVWDFKTLSNIRNFKVCVF